MKRERGGVTTSLRKSTHICRRKQIYLRTHRRRSNYIRKDERCVQVVVVMMMMMIRCARGRGEEIEKKSVLVVYNSLYVCACA